MKPERAGGKFVNGAVTTAMQHLFNSEALVVRGLAAGWVGAVVEPTPIGDFVMGVATGAAVAAYGPEIIDKMEVEISAILAKAAGPDGVQYSLRAQVDGIYECYRCATGKVALEAGYVWKYGETTTNNRYSETSLNRRNVRFVTEYRGNRMQIKVMEKYKIYGYALRNQMLPPGNKIFR